MTALAAPPRLRPPSQGPARQATVLVADDDPDILSLVGYRLERAGYAVIRASDGQQALRLAVESPPDLCVLDLMMPKLDGLGVARALREDQRTEQVPIVLLTARVGDDDVTRGFNAGVNDYMTKPFSPQELTARVQRVLGRIAA